jgi:hypothetical protein
MGGKVRRTMLAAFASALLFAMSGDKTIAAGYGDEAYDGYGYTDNACTGGLYPIYGYGGYIGPYYRNGCYGDPYDCGSARIRCTSRRHGGRH